MRGNIIYFYTSYFPISFLSSEIIGNAGIEVAEKMKGIKQMDSQVILIVYHKKV